jgi:excisionase family DNA binding protein
LCGPEKADTKVVLGGDLRMSNAVHQMLREVMDIRQASEYLGISGDTLYRYASEGFIPAFKLGNRWRFKRSLLDAWMVEKSGSRAPADTPGVAVMPKQKKPVRRAR